MTFDDMPDLNEQIMNRRGADEPDAEEAESQPGAAGEEAEQAEEGGEEEAMEARSAEQEELMARAADLQNQLNAARFKSFIPALICAVLKDLIDAVTLGVAGTLANIPLAIFLFYVFNIEQRRWKKELKGKHGAALTKGFWTKYIIALIVEFIPGFNMFPTYTIRVLMIKHACDKQSGAIMAELTAIENQLR